METALAQNPDPMATTPVQEAYQQPAVQHDAQPSPDPSHLEQHQGEHQAPAPTSDAEHGEVIASAPETPSYDIDELLRIKQESEAAQQELEELRQTHAQIRRMAEEQQAQAANAQLRTEIQQEIAALLQKSGVEDEDTIAALTDKMFGRVDGTRQSYQQQMTEWQAQVEASYSDGLWKAVRDGFASDLVQQKNLNPVVLPHLKQARDQDEMVRLADFFAQTQKYYETTATQNRITEQEQERRNSGVDVVTGTNSGPLANEPLKPGRNLDVLGAILSGV